MILPPNALHGLYNRGKSICRLLGISTTAHQAFIDAVAEADNASSFYILPPDAAFRQIAYVALENHMYLAPFYIRPPADSNR